ncbi:hypothetical protein [Thalassobellus suaedae]|uniref:Glycosyltransferase n=1 Tax=Thalassobellus suaedae TaxID=3074124 RepID=A0ABY9XVE6_9FLAO|nr:hypothetical protein RHP51_02565 [Flavobacteriaceae bacterium HL-DH14]
MKKYKVMYPGVIHQYIPHPLYSTSFKNFDKVDARTQLGIKADKHLVVVPGNVRLKEERDLILKAFNSLKLKNKLLLIPNMYKKEVSIEFKGRHLLKKLIDVKKVLEYFCNKDYIKKYQFEYGFTDIDRLSLILSASDVVFIPRINALNSGNVFLGFTYKKVVVGPDIGNIGEELKNNRFPVFNPYNQDSIVKALERGLNMNVKSRKKVDFEKIWKKYNPNIISKQYDDFFKVVLKE